MHKITFLARNKILLKPQKILNKNILYDLKRALFISFALLAYKNSISNVVSSMNFKLVLLLTPIHSHKSHMFVYVSKTRMYTYMSVCFSMYCSSLLFKYCNIYLAMNMYKF